jgi:hypothetical protein
MQGSMKIERRAIRTGAVVLVACALFAAAIPLGAQAGPLLSGYGGPGEGNQAILGSTLLGGPGGGAPGAGGPSRAADQGPGSVSATPAHGRSAGPSGARRSSPPARQPTGALAAGGSGQPASGLYPAVERTTAPGGLGLTGADISYIVMAAAVLAFTGVLTRRLARTRAAKGH